MARYRARSPWRPQTDCFSRGQTVFDYGCGRGDDLRHLRQLGYEADGWDPAHRPNTERRPADIVNLGYVVNVIENQSERATALRSAWELARNLPRGLGANDLGRP